MKIHRRISHICAYCQAISIWDEKQDTYHQFFPEHYHVEARTKVLSTDTSAPPEQPKCCSYLHCNSISVTDLRFMNGELIQCRSHCRENTSCRIAPGFCLQSQQPISPTANSLRHHEKASSESRILSSVHALKLPSETPFRSALCAGLELWVAWQAVQE